MKRRRKEGRKRRWGKRASGGSGAARCGREEKPSLVKLFNSIVNRYLFTT